MIWRMLVTIFGTIFMVSACIAVLIYFMERINYKKVVERSQNFSNQETRNLAIVTGASSGLGRDYVRFLCKNKEYEVDELIIIARREDRLQDLKDSIDLPTTVYPMDMTNDLEMAEFKRFLEKKIDDENLSINYLINSAGMGRRGLSLELGSEIENKTAAINCQAQVSMIHIVANLMHAGGQIIQIASVAGFNPIGYLNAYSASKAYIYTYARGLRTELLKEGINVTTVCPYWVNDTEFLGKAKVRRNIILPLKSKHVVEKSMKDTCRGFALSTPGFVGTVDRIFSGLIPDEILVYLTRWFV